MSIVPRLLYSKITYWLFALLFVTLPFSPPYLSPIIGVLLLLNWFCELHFQERFSRIDSLPKKILIIVGLLFFIVYCIGFLYAPDSKRALISIGKKIWFFIAPLLFFTIDTNYFTKDKIQKLLFYFLCASFSMIIINLCISTVEVIYSGSTHFYTYKWLSHFTHPTYSAMYVCIALLVALVWSFSDSEDQHIKRRTLLLFFITLYVYYLLMLQSKTGYMALIVLLAILVVKLIKEKRLMGMLLIGLCILALYFTAFPFAVKLLIAIFSIVFSINFFLYKRKSLSLLIFFSFFTLFISSFTTILKVPLNRSSQFVEDISEDANPEGSTNTRIAIWHASFDVIFRNPIYGSGTSSARARIEARAKEMGDEHYFVRNPNCHNQYLETLIDTGVLGLIVLISLLGVPFYLSIKKKNLFLFCFLTVVMINLLTESQFEYYIGSDFVALFMGLFSFMMLCQSDLKQTYVLSD
jgi:O-antigen ligase